MLIPDYIEESILWAETCIKGRRRGKGEINHLKNLLELIKIFTEKDDKKLER
jgi:hypothetical protein